MKLVFKDLCYLLIGLLVRAKLLLKLYLLNILKCNILNEEHYNYLLYMALFRFYRFVTLFAVYN